MAPNGFKQPPTDGKIRIANVTVVGGYKRVTRRQKKINKENKKDTLD